MDAFDHINERLTLLEKTPSELIDKIVSLEAKIDDLVESFDELVEKISDLPLRSYD